MGLRERTNTYLDGDAARNGESGRYVDHTCPDSDGCCFGNAWDGGGAEGAVEGDDGKFVEHQGVLGVLDWRGCGWVYEVRLGSKLSCCVRRL